MWNHPLKNNSFCVFQGRREPFTIEFPVSNENVSKILNSVALNVEARRYQNEWDYAVNKDVGFSEMYVWNTTNCTGLLGLNAQKGLSDTRRFPQTNGNKQEILFTSDKGYHNINYLYNRVLNQNNNIPIFSKDANNIFKDINTNAVKFSGKKVLERMKGDTFIVNLTENKDSRYNLIFKNSINNETTI